MATAKKKKPVQKKSSKKPVKKSAVRKGAVTAKKTAAKAAPKNAAKMATPVPLALGRALRPLHDRIVVIVEGASEVTAGGIIIPGSVTERPSRGRVVAKGPGRRSKKGLVRPLDVSVGDCVLFPELAGTQVVMNGTELLILREEEILGIAE